MATPLALLLVEDSPDDAYLIERELAKNGYVPRASRVCTAPDMEAALRGRAWDVICSDYRMPAFDTQGALEVRSRLAPDTPLIVISGSIGETAAVDLLKAGADDYIPKENLSRLASAVRREIREAGERRARRAAEDERSRLVDELAQALRVRDDFLMIASHELRTPLTALRLYLQSIARLADRGEQDRIPHKVTSAERQVERLEQLISDMVSVSQVRPGELTLRPAELELSAFLGELARRFARAQDAEQLLTVSLPERLVARADRAQLEEAVGRLLSNAFKYGVGNPIEVSLAEQGGVAVIAVTDHGIGIPAEDQERIFDRFGRAVPVANFGGFGLGLWIARTIFEAHGGTLTVASEVGKGSTFTARLPVPPPKSSA